MDGFDGLLDFAKTPEGQGLLAAVAGGLAGAQRGTPINNIGRGGLAGIAGYSNALQTQNSGELRDIQLQKLRAEQQAAQNQQDAIGRIDAGRQKDPKYQPSFADLAMIDKGAAIKTFAPETAVDFGLEPKIGMNPSSGKLSYFVQDKRGGTRWLDAAVPPDFQLVQGTDYRAPQVFNKREGAFANPPSGAPAQQMPQSSGLPAPMSYPSSSNSAPMQTSAQEDPNAPWAGIISPAKREEMRIKTFEQANKALEDMRAQVASGRNTQTQLDRFGELNRQEGTGGLWNNLPTPTTNEQKKEMEAIVSRLAPAQRPAGSGTTSDRDLALYLAGLPGIDKPGPVNKAIRDQFNDQLKNAEGGLAYRERFLNDYGHLNGVEAARQTSAQNEKSGGLDISKLTPDQRAYLQQQDPDAYQRGIERLQKNSQSAPKQAIATAFDSLPKAATLKGKTIRDTATGKLMRSNGMSWVEVK